MPIYEYVCDECGRQFEELAGGFELLPTPCPQCRSDKTRKVLSRTAACGCGGKTADSGGPGGCGPAPGGLGGGCGSGGFS